MDMFTNRKFSCVYAGIISYKMSQALCHCSQESVVRADQDSDFSLSDSQPSGSSQGSYVPTRSHSENYIVNRKSLLSLFK
jgi:hypothetical protein